MSSIAPHDWDLEIEDHGRAGVIHYREAGQRIRFEWEFGGGSVIAIITCPAFSEWDETYPWAVGRRLEIMERVSREVIIQKAPDCRAESGPARRIRLSARACGGLKPSLKA